MGPAELFVLRPRYKGKIIRFLQGIAEIITLLPEMIVSHWIFLSYAYHNMLYAPICCIELCIVSALVSQHMKDSLSVRDLKLHLTSLV